MLYGMIAVQMTFQYIHAMSFSLNESASRKVIREFRVEAQKFRHVQ